MGSVQAFTARSSMIWILFLILGPCSLGSSQALEDASEVGSVTSDPQDERQLDRLVKRREEIKKWALLCPEGESRGQYTERSGKCYQWDVALFSGLSCLAATLARDEETSLARCSEIRQSQGEDGRWWRGPTRRDREEPNSFSRDMARGVLAYFIARGLIHTDFQEREDVRDSAKRWLDWILFHGNSTLCRSTIDGNNLCQVTVGLAALFHAIYRELGILPGEDSETHRNFSLIQKIHRANGTFFSLLPIAVAMAPKGYPLHLKATTLLLYSLIGQNKGKAFQDLLSQMKGQLYSRDPDHLLFEFLHKGVTGPVFDKVLSLCPAERPKAPGGHHDFQWQRESSADASKRSDGHDCIYLINLMIAKEKGYFD